MRTTRLPAVCLAVAAIIALDWPVTSRSATNNVSVENDFFSPASVTNHVNDTVLWTWVNDGPIDHSSTSDTQLWDSGIIGNASTFSHQFTTAGSFPYHCNVHSFMLGSVVVQSAGSLLPSVSITSPTNNATFSASASFTITASASETGGAISQVQFFQGTTLLAAATSAPYQGSVGALAAGTYTFSAVATDGGGVKATNSISVQVLASASPSVSITSPTNNATFSAPASLTIAASASEAGGTIAQVQFFQGTTSLAIAAAAPYQAQVSALAAGSYTISAVATDGGGVMATNSISIQVLAKGGPSVTITNPANNATFSAAASFTLAANASESGGTIAQVQFFQGTTSLAIATTAPYLAQVTALAAGSYTFSAVATDGGGVMATNSISVQVFATGGPSVTITSPTNNSTFSAAASFTITATAAEAGGTISQVQFFQGTTLLASATNPPYQAQVSALAAGNYTFSAVATDVGGVKATNSVSIQVGASVSPLLSSPQWIPPSTFRFTYSSDTNSTYAVDGTFDFSSWTALQTNTAVAASTVFSTTNTASAQTFYRVRRLSSP